MPKRCGGVCFGLQIINNICQGIGMKKLISILCLSTLITGFTSYISISKDLHLKCGSHEILLEDCIFSTKVSVATETTNYLLRVTKNVTVNKKQIVLHGKNYSGEFYTDKNCSIPTTCSVNTIYSRTGNKKSIARDVLVKPCYRIKKCKPKSKIRKYHSGNPNIPEVGSPFEQVYNPGKCGSCTKFQGPFSSYLCTKQD